MEILTIAYDEEQVHRISSTNGNKQSIVELLQFVIESLHLEPIEEVEGEMQ